MNSTAIAAGYTIAGKEQRFRTDIQALRGFAVLLVVFYHAAPKTLQAGYLGVDIFFVLSGYLITNLVKQGIDNGTFSFSSFYSRRAKRLLPAAYTMFFAVALLSGILLTRLELKAFSQQLIGAVTFTANFVLRAQTGYFGGEAELKPLLHMWSLAIEEQYYLIWPAFLVFLPKHYWTLGASSVFAASLFLYLIFFFTKPVAAFYLLPTRAWELALGSIGAVSFDEGRYRQVISAGYAPALFALLIIPFSWPWGVYADLKAPILCLATIVVILSRRELHNRALPIRLLTWFGGISYSLYLVHWPIFAFLNNAWIGHPPAYVGVICVGLSILLGYVLYRYIEKPVRRANVSFSWMPAACTLALSGALMLTPFGILWATRNQPDFAYIARINHGLDEGCDVIMTFPPKPQCRTSDTPSILVWGDSFAAHLVSGISKTSGNLGVVQASRALCGPFSGLSPISKLESSDYGRPFAESCFDFNQSVLRYLSRATSVKVVVLSSPFDYYLDPEAFRLLQQRLREIDVDTDVVVSEMKRTVDSVRALGKRVVVVAPPPSADFDIARCYERKVTGKPNLGPNSECLLLVRSYRSKKKSVLQFLDRLPTEAGVRVISFDNLLCGAELCKTVLEGHLLYWDNSHLSYGGSEILAERMGLVKSILAEAR